MATKAKKKQRRERRRLQRRGTRSIPSEILICEGTAETVLVLEAADEGDEEKPKVRRFSMTAYTGGKLELPNFYDPVVVDLSGLRVTAKARPMLRDHRLDQIVGHTEKIQVSAGSIKIEGVLSGANEFSREVAASADNGFPWQASIGARVTQAAFVDRGESVTVNGRKFTGPLIVARKSVLRETSFVALGADDNTSAKIAASASSSRTGVREMEFEKWLEANGWDNFDELSEQQQKTIQAGYDAEVAASPGDGNDPGTADPNPTGKPIKAAAGQDPGGDEDPIAAYRELKAQEIERQDGIAAICARYDNPKIKINNKEESIEAVAIRDNWTLEKTELEAMRESRPKASAGHAHSHEGDCTVEALSAAMILSFNGRLDHPAYTNSIQAVALGIPAFLRAGIDDEQRQRFMEAAHRYSDMNALAICAEAVRLDGRQVPRGRGELIQAAVSGSTLTQIFTTSVNARLLVGFAEAPDTTAGWTQQRDVADFKTYENIRLQKGAGLAPHPRGGKADHWSRADQQETNKIARYSRQFFVDEQDFIDDQLDALDSTPAEMGQAARRLVPDLVYAVLLSNPTLNATSRQLFNATDANLDTGSALSAANLKTGVSEMMIVQENGVNLNLAPTHILVPPARKHLAYELTNSSQIFLAGDTDTERGNLNALRVDNIVPVAEARLQNGSTHPGTGVTHSGSATDWYLVNNRVRTIEVAFLRGTGRAPQTSTWRRMGEDGEWGIGFSAKMDVGAAAQEWRGLRKHEE